MITVMSRPDNNHNPSATSSTPMTTVANGRYRCAEAISGEITRPKTPNTVTKPAAMASVAVPARASAAGRVVGCPSPTITRPR